MAKPGFILWAGLAGFDFNWLMERGGAARGERGPNKLSTSMLTPVSAQVEPNFNAGFACWGCGNGFDDKGWSRLTGVGWRPAINLFHLFLFKLINNSLCEESIYLEMISQYVLVTFRKSYNC